jgi:hypothetical protein
MRGSILTVPFGIMPDGQHFVFQMGQVASGATYCNVVPLV